MKKLSIEEKQELTNLLTKTKDVQERNRLCVILAYDDDITKVSIARTLRIDPQTVDKYLKEYRRDRKTKNKPRGGSDSKLSEKDSKELTDHLQRNTYLKVQAICAYVKERYGIEYSRTGMRDWLQRQGFRYKRPEKVPGRLNPEKQRLFVEEYKSLKNDLSDGEEIYFFDATHPEYQSQSVCGWIKKGEKKTLQTTAKQVRLHIAGAIELNSLKLCSEEYSTIDSKAVIDFFKKLESSSKAGVIHVILDNAKSNKNKKLAEFIKSSKIKLHYLPPYSPNLNPIERLWKIMREKTLYNRFYESADLFFGAVRIFFQETVPKAKELLKSRINDNFQTIKLNPIKLVV
jgi:transposase